MSQRNPIALFIGGFVVCYVILVLPWPGWNRIYGAGFRALARAAFTSDSGSRDLSFSTCGENTPRPLETRIVIVNRNLMHEDGSGPVRNFDLDAQSFAWNPTALLIALIVATPLPWKRRIRALLWGLPCIHIIILLGLGFCVWNESTEVELVTLTRFWKYLADAHKELLVSQFNLVMPLVVWVAVTFRRSDRDGAIGRSLFGPRALGPTNT